MWCPLPCYHTACRPSPTSYTGTPSPHDHESNTFLFFLMRTPKKCHETFGSFNQCHQGNANQLPKSSEYIQRLKSRLCQMQSDCLLSTSAGLNTTTQVIGTSPSANNSILLLRAAGNHGRCFLGCWSSLGEEVHWGVCENGEWVPVRCVSRG